MIVDELITWPHRGGVRSDAATCNFLLCRSVGQMLAGRVSRLETTRQASPMCGFFFARMRTRHAGRGILRLPVADSRTHGRGHAPSSRYPDRNREHCGTGPETRGKTQSIELRCGVTRYDTTRLILGCGKWWILLPARERRNQARYRQVDPASAIRCSSFTFPFLLLWSFTAKLAAFWGVFAFASVFSFSF